MALNLEQQVGRWLRSMGINISSSLLREKLQTHPDYPSLLSVTDTLDDLGIDNAALQIEKEWLNEAPLPFLAHNAAKGEFVIINDIAKQISENPYFEKNWNGTALLAEKTYNWQHTENLERLGKERKRKQTILLALSSVVALAGLCLINNFSWQQTGLLITTLAGCAIAVLIMQHELGISNELTEQLCSAGKHTDCDAVMHSKGSHLSKWLNWADAGIIYFASYSFLLVTLLYTGNAAVIFLLAILSCAAVPFTLFSLYYQWRIVKKWCTLCLLTVSVLWLQFFFLLPVTLSLSKGDTWRLIAPSDLLFTAFTFCTISTAWLLLLNPAFKKNKDLRSKNFFLLRFKNNPDVFVTFLKQQRKADTTPFENDLQLGNPDAAVQIVIACNPYCSPCATAHKTLHELAEATDIGLTIRLSVKPEDNEDKRTIAGKYIMQVVNKMGTDFKRNVLHDWYALMDLEKFMKKYPLQKETDIRQQLQAHEQWNKEAKIEFTPTLFINGYQLPRQYRTEDLKNLLKRMEKITETSEAIITENNLALV